MSLASIRAKLQAQENRGQSTTQQSAGDNAVFAHWNMEEGTQATIRFLPDADPNNSFFWVERSMIKLPFNGVKGRDGKQVIVQVPCVEMYGDACPVLAEVRTWYKDESLKEMANKYWKKRTYLFQGFVKTNPMSDDKTPENPIRRFVISPQIFQVIKNSLMDPEIEELPTDSIRGLDFNIKKTSKGGYADYSTSNWARKESAITEADQSAIDQFGLYNLRDFLPKKPSESELRVIKEMFEASVDGQPYDAERWGAYFKPWGLDVGDSKRSDDGESAPAPAARPAPVAQPVITKVTKPAVTETAPWEEEVEQAEKSFVKPTTTGGSDKATDILAMIRSRQNKPA
jgi:hypothetical protein